jgi:hypothetical protein
MLQCTVDVFVIFSAVNDPWLTCLVCFASIKVMDTTDDCVQSALIHVMFVIYVCVCIFNHS